MYLFVNRIKYQFVYLLKKLNLKFFSIVNKYVYSNNNF